MHGDWSTAGAHAKKHPASLQGTLGFLGFDGFTQGNVEVPRSKIDRPPGGSGLGFLRRVSCGRDPTVASRRPGQRRMAAGQGGA